MCKAQLTSPPHPMRDKRVSFAKSPVDPTKLDVQVKLIDTKLATDQRKVMFYSRKEKKHMIESARKVVARVTEQDRCNYSICEKRHIDNYEFDYCPILLRAFESCHKKAETITEQERHYLTEWMIYGHARRGLEKACVQRLNASMYQRRKRAITAVLQMHAALMTRRGVPPANHVEVIATVYREISAQSVIFAQLMGQLDQGAAMKGVRSAGQRGFVQQSPGRLTERQASF